MENMIVAGITAIGLIITQIIINYRQNNIILYRLDKIEDKQDKHNGIMEKTYRLEEKVKKHEDWLIDMEHKLH